MNNQKEPQEILEDDSIMLFDNNGKAIYFTQIAGVAHDGDYYVILKPITPIDGHREDEAFVYSVSYTDEGEDKYELVTDDDIINAVFNIYNRLLSGQK